MNNEWIDPIERLLDREGPWADDPDDVGGCTRYGWTLKTYNDTAGTSLNCAELKEVPRYYMSEMYWRHWITHRRLQLHIMVPIKVAECVLDTAVLFGRRRAAIMLQKSIGEIEADGWIGQKTREALTMKDSRRVIAGIVSQRVMKHSRRVQERPDQTIFLAGWNARALNWLEVA